MIKEIYYYRNLSLLFNEVYPNTNTTLNNKKIYYNERIIIVYS